MPIGLEQAGPDFGIVDRDDLGCPRSAGHHDRLARPQDESLRAGQRAREGNAIASPAELSQRMHVGGRDRLDVGHVDPHARPAEPSGNP